MTSQYEKFAEANSNYAEFISHPDKIGKGWLDGDNATRDAGIGIACMLAYIDGCKPTLSDLAEVLKIDAKIIEKSYVRLLRSGMFSYAYNARNDDILLGRDITNSCKCVRERTVYWDSVAAWCHVAGVAAGLIERNINRNKSHLNFARYRNRK
jgi:hypothetical protein